MNSAYLLLVEEADVVTVVEYKAQDYDQGSKQACYSAHRLEEQLFSEKQEIG